MDTLDDGLDPRLALYQQVAELVRRAIRSGEYTPGERLPSANELALTLGVAAMTVKNAYAALRGQGVVRTVQGDGTYITADALTILNSPETAATGADLRDEVRALNAKVDRVLNELGKLASTLGYGSPSGRKIPEQRGQ